MKESEEMLEKAIEDGFDQLDQTTDIEDYCKKAKAVKELYDLKINEYKSQAEDGHESDKLALERTKIEHERKKDEEDAKWWKKINPNTVITTGAMVLMSAVTIIEQHQGWIFKPDGFLAKLMNKDK